MSQSFIPKWQREEKRENGPSRNCEILGLSVTMTMTYSTSQSGKDCIPADVSEENNDGDENEKKTCKACKESCSYEKV